MNNDSMPELSVQAEFLDLKRLKSGHYGNDL